MFNPTPSLAAPAAGSTSPYAAVFIDFENIYYFLKNHYLDPQDPHDYALDLLRSLRDALKTQYGLESLVLNAYADFDKLPTGPQGPLYLMGVTTRNVLGTDHKNAADMQLCIDALEVLYTRPAIGTFVLVGGDRDYIPVIQHLRRQARLVKVVGFRESVSGDLLQLLGQEQFLDARDLLPPARLQALEDHRTARLARGEEIRRLREQGLPGVQSAAARLAAQYAAQQAALTPPAETPGAEGAPAPDASPAAARPDSDAAQEAGGPDLATEAASLPPAAANPPAPALAGELPEPARYPALLPVAYLAAGLPLEPNFAPIRRIVRDDTRRCLEYLLEQVQKYGSQQVGPPEIWASPFLRRLTDVLPELPDWERRQLLTSLRDDGAVRIEKREGEPHAFSVIILNYQHPDVRELLPGIEQQQAALAQQQAALAQKQPDQ